MEFSKGRFGGAFSTPSAASIEADLPLRVPGSVLRSLPPSSTGAHIKMRAPNHFGLRFILSIFVLSTPAHGKPEVSLQRNGASADVCGSNHRNLQPRSWLRALELAAPLPPPSHGKRFTAPSATLSVIIGRRTTSDSPFRNGSQASARLSFTARAVLLKEDRLFAASGPTLVLHFPWPTCRRSTRRLRGTLGAQSQEPSAP